MRMENFCVIFATLISLSNSQLVFPDDDDNPVSRNNKDTRQPVYITGKCPDNEWYWPGSSENDWICDCAALFVYYAPGNKCYEVYRQGPCRKNEYLIIPEDEVVAECVRNPCVNDTIVPFHGNCYQLHKTDACDKRGGGTLTVNHTTLDLECSTQVTELHIINIGNIPCPPGSKRAGRGCRQTVSKN